MTAIEKTVTVVFTLDEIECISAAVSRDQDRTLDEFCRRGGIKPDGRTRLLTQTEVVEVPFHQAVLSKIGEALMVGTGDHKP